MRRTCKFYTTRHNFDVANKTKNKCKLIYPESRRHVAVFLRVSSSGQVTMVEASPDTSHSNRSTWRIRRIKKGFFKVEAMWIRFT